MTNGWKSFHGFGGKSNIIKSHRKAGPSIKIHKKPTNRTVGSVVRNYPSILKPVFFLFFTFEKRHIASSYWSSLSISDCMVSFKSKKKKRKNCCFFHFVPSISIWLQFNSSLKGTVKRKKQQSKLSLPFGYCNS